MIVRRVIKLIQAICLSLPKCKAEGVAYPPVFIVGVPRSGTTIIFDSLVGGYKVGYFSNVMMLLPFFSYGIAKLFKSSHLNYIAGEGRSNLGFVSGVFAPSEAGALNRYMFEAPEVVGVEKIRSYYGAISKLFGGSVLNKNLYNSLRISNILRVFPSAAFIHVRRDPRYVVQSIYLARIKLFGDAAKWWSVRPDSCPNFSDPIEEIVWQVATIESTIRSGLEVAMVSAEIPYAQFCEHPNLVLSHVAKVCGLKTKQERVVNVKQIANADRVSVEKQVWEKIEYYCRAYKLCQ